MADKVLMSGLNFYQSANADAETIKNDFIVRHHEYDVIMDDLRNRPMAGSVQHYLLLGRRGSGKSTLLKRIQVEIDGDPILSNKYIAINLAEEQANIYKLYDLWEDIIEELEYRGIKTDKPEWDEDEQNYLRQLFEAIHSTINKAGKKIVLLLDNIDRIFENVKEDASMLRETLLNYDDIKIIGGSTRMTEHFWKYDMPFYEFFRVLPLKPLDSKEIRELLLHWADRYNLRELKTFVRKKPGQLEAIRILTDGLPRTLQFFVNILINKEQETGYQYVKLIMDQVTPQYQERLNILPPSQRKIVLQMAFLWEAVGAKEISKSVRMTNSVVSAQLKQLTDKAVVEKIETDTKNHLYRLAERFFNLWLIFTQGSPIEKRKAKYLTIFLENFYNEKELKDMVRDHLKCLDGKTMHPDKAAMLTKALAQSKYISTDDRDQLIIKTQLLENVTEDIKKQLPHTTKKFYDSIIECVENRNWLRAFALIEEIEQEDGLKESFSGIVYFYQKNFDLAEKYYKAALKKGREASLFNLALLYHAQQKYDQAEKYYTQAADIGDNDAILNLGVIYKKIQKYDLAEKYYKKAVEKGVHSGLRNLGLLYKEQERYDLAEQYFKKAIDSGDFKAMLNIAVMFESLEKYDLAEKYYKKAINNGDEGAIVNLGALYHDLGRYNLAVKYNKMAIGRGNKLALENLLKLYYIQNINKNDAFELLNKHELNNIILEAIIKLWTGRLDDVEKTSSYIAINKHFEDFDVLILELLIHKQVNIVTNLFNKKEFGQDIIDRFTPLYYATQLLADGVKTQLKIPPEIRETVDEIIEYVEERRKVYYNDKA